MPSTGLEDLPRVDYINTQPLPDAVEQEVIEYLREFAASFDIIFISDQADTRRGGVVTPAVRALLEEIAQANPKKIIWVDSRLRVERFRNMILKPNEREASAASIGAVRRGGLSAFAKSRQFEDGFRDEGPQGVVVVEEGGESLVPAFQVGHPVDVSGAGDSFSAGAALALAITGSAIEAARFGNLVASITVKKRGTGVASPEEVLALPRAHMSTLAIDVGGTKFSVAVFEGKRMLERESHSTDRAGRARLDARERMEAVIRSLAARHRFDCCGIGFGGPGGFRSAARGLIHARSRMDRFRSSRPSDKSARICSRHGQRCQCRSAGRSLYGAGRGYRPLFYLTLSTGIGGGLVSQRHRLSRRGFLRGRDRPSDRPPRRSRMFVRVTRLPGADVLRIVAGARLWPAGERTAARSCLCGALCCRPGAWGSRPRSCC